MPEASLRRSLVLFPGALGDFICFFPALQTLSRCAQVDLLAQSAFADLVPPTVRVRSLECCEISRLFVPGSAQEERMRNFFGSYFSIYSWMGNGQREFVRELQSASRGRVRVFPFRPVWTRMHQADYYLSCLGEDSPEPRIPEIALKPEAVEWCENYWARRSLNGKAVLALAPGSGAKEKNWPVALFQAAAEWWRQRTAGEVVVVLGPVEEEREGYGSLFERAVVARKLSLVQLAALLVQSDLYLGNDSGVTHLAAALGVRTIALFGPSDVQQWAPRGQKVAILAQNMECSPCTIPVMKSCPHRRCLTTLEPAIVIREMEKLTDIPTLTRGGVGIKVKIEVPGGSTRETSC